MKRMNFRKTLSAVVLMSGLIAAASALAQAQSGYGPGNGRSGMMGGDGAGWMGGYGFGGMWVPILVVIVVAGLVAWIVAQKKK